MWASIKSLQSLHHHEIGISSSVIGSRTRNYYYYPGYAATGRYSEKIPTAHFSLKSEWAPKKTSDRFFFFNPGHLVIEPWDIRNGVRKVSHEIRKMEFYYGNSFSVIKYLWWEWWGHFSKYFPYFFHSPFPKIREQDSLQISLIKLITQISWIFKLIQLILKILLKFQIEETEHALLFYQGD